MKKLVITIAAIASFLAIGTTASAQEETMKQSAENLIKLVEDALKTPLSGDAVIDDYAKSSFDLGRESAETTLRLEVINSKVDAGTLPSLTEIKEIGESLEKQAKTLKELTEKTPDATNAVENIAKEAKSIKNPVQAKKALSKANNARKELEFSGKALKITGEQIAANSKIVAEITSKLTQ